MSLKFCEHICDRSHGVFFFMEVTESSFWRLKWCQHISLAFLVIFVANVWGSEVLMPSKASRETWRGEFKIYWFSQNPGLSQNVQKAGKNLKFIVSLSLPCHLVRLHMQLPLYPCLLSKPGWSSFLSEYFRGWFWDPATGIGEDSARTPSPGSTSPSLCRPRLQDARIPGGSGSGMWAPNLEKEKSLANSRITANVE